VALIGVVVMNYHGYLIGRGGDPGTGWAADLFDPWSGPLSTRFAATFVLVAGVGVALMSRRVNAARIGGAGLADGGEPGVRQATVAMRWRLARRGLLLYVVGLWIDVIWPGTILVYYGALFVIAAVIVTWRTRWIVASGVVAVAAGWVIQIWRFHRIEDGESTEWLTDPGHSSIRGFVFDVAVNGSHPLLPWLAFFCAGIVLGRILGAARWEPWWRAATIGLGTALFVISTLIGDLAGSAFTSLLLSTEPFDRGGMYVMSALGTALVAYATIDWAANRFPTATDPLRRAGQLTLTIYLLHIFVFNAVVDWFGWVRPAGLGTALLCAVVFWVAAIAAATWWSRRHGMGPAERVYRAFGG
jgi:uncharacterized membrane protein YeiB